MIQSFSKELFPVQIPVHTGELKMMPFNLSDLSGVPEKFISLVRSMISFLPIKTGVAYLTVDGKEIQKGSSHRRGGPHTDGNYLQEGDWGKGGGNGWKVGGDGRTLSPEEHKLSYESSTGGMIIVSDYPACKGWNGVYDGLPNTGGDCSHINLSKGFILKPNTVYYGNSQWIHESLPVNKTVHRTLVRITLPTDYPWLN